MERYHELDIGPHLPLYLGRVGIPENEALPPTLETLRRLQRAHMETFAFENLSVHVEPGF
jgi:arylamine N-acetyltransferase